MVVSKIPVLSVLSFCPLHFRAAIFGAGCFLCSAFFYFMLFLRASHLRFRGCILSALFYYFSFNSFKNASFIDIDTLVSVFNIERSVIDGRINEFLSTLDKGKRGNHVIFNQGEDESPAKVDLAVVASVVSGCRHD